MGTHLPAEAPQPRLCIVKKSYPEEEYGFNLHAERTKGQFIGKVDPKSPADRAGLQQGDRIIAVNGVSIAQDSHKQVVARVKEDPLQTKLLVIDADGVEWYRNHGIEIRPDQSNIVMGGDDAVHIAQDQSRPVSYSATPPVQHRTMEEPEIRPRSSHDDRPKPRLCRLIKHTQHDEFGFNLHAEKGKGHFIGKVDDNGLAEKAGLEQSQRIVGVNGTLIYPATQHSEVVSLIKAKQLEAVLLVASPSVDEWYRTHDAEYSFDYCEDWDSLHINGHVAHTPTNNAEPMHQHYNGSSSANDSVTVIAVEGIETKREPVAPLHHVQNDMPTHHRDSPVMARASPPMYDENSNGPAIAPFRGSSGSDSFNGSMHGSGSMHSPGSAGEKPVPNMNMTAAEMRQQLASRKKRDPRREQTMSMQEKYQIAQNL